MARPIIFLHIPKTAGQSVHTFLRASFRDGEICPARQNIHLAGLSIIQLRQYQLFSGHLDWAQLDCVHPDPFVFTVMREPIDRILSFYFFLRRNAQKASPNELQLPKRRGLRAILELSPDDYFTKGPPGLRAFIDDHFDNFYTYYFCGRTFNARRRLANHLKPGRGHSIDEYLETARQNLAFLSGVYRVSEMDRLESDLLNVLPKRHRRRARLKNIRKNVGTGDRDSRIQALRAIGPAEKALKRIGEMCAHDDCLWADDSLFRAR